MLRTKSACTVSCICVTGCFWTVAFVAVRKCHQAGARQDAVRAMPIVVFRRDLPQKSLLAGLKKFLNASSITCSGSAPAEVLSQRALPRD